MKNNILAVVVSVGCLLSASSSFAAPGDTLWLPVTYFDYHSTRTNPDFEPFDATRYSVVTSFALGGGKFGWISKGGVPNMVQPILGSNGVPVKGTKCEFSWGIDKWFVPNISEAGKTYKKPVYELLQGPAPAVPARFRDTLRTVDVVGVNPYENRVIEDSLPFVFNAVAKTYTFQAGTGKPFKPQFNPIDTRGFGRENYAVALPAYGVTGNFSFSMMLKTKFKYVPGQTFTFRGDDDTWLFLDNHLVVDLGGIMSDSVTVNVDTEAAKYGWVSGNYYSFDFFNCERQYYGAAIKITAGMQLVKPARKLR